MFKEKSKNMVSMASMSNSKDMGVLVRKSGFALNFKGCIFCNVFSVCVYGASTFDHLEVSTRSRRFFSLFPW